MSKFVSEQKIADLKYPPDKKSPIFRLSEKIGYEDGRRALPFFAAEGNVVIPFGDSEKKLIWNEEKEIFELTSNSLDGASIKDLTIDNAKIKELAAGKIIAGTITSTINLGSGYVKLDGANKRIIINDGTVDRILIGYDQNGF